MQVRTSNKSLALRLVSLQTPGALDFCELSPTRRLSRGPAPCWCRNSPHSAYCPDAGCVLTSCRMSGLRVTMLEPRGRKSRPTCEGNWQQAAARGLGAQAYITRRQRSQCQTKCCPLPASMVDPRVWAKQRLPSLPQPARKPATAAVKWQGLARPTQGGPTLPLTHNSATGGVASRASASPEPPARSTCRCSGCPPQLSGADRA